MVDLNSQQTNDSSYPTIIKFPDKTLDSTPEGLFYYYESDDVDKWIYQCMKDFPRPHGGVDGEYSHEYYDRDLMDEWFNKWFKQFINVKFMSQWRN